MILIKANLLQLYTRHISEQTVEEFFDIRCHTRLQDPASVFADPDYVIL